VQALNSAIPSWAASLNSTESPIWVVNQNSGIQASDLRDGIHPNQSGDQKMEAVWYPAVVNALQVIQGGSQTSSSSATPTTFETQTSSATAVLC
jgi:hypothetical protein